MDIASGMDYLHSLGVLHGDVKGANVLLRTNAPTPYDARGFVCKVGCRCYFARAALWVLLPSLEAARLRLHGFWAERKLSPCMHTYLFFLLLLLCYSSHLRTCTHVFTHRRRPHQRMQNRNRKEVASGNEPLHS